MRLLTKTSAGRPHASLSLLALVLFLVASSVCLCVTAADATNLPPLYDPTNEGLIERFTRYVQIRLMSRSDEEITKGRIATAESLRPTFHSSITVLKDAKNPERVQDILQMPPPPAKREADDIPFPWEIGKAKDDQEWKVWVVLITAPEGDAPSRMLNSIFNKTVAYIKEEGTEGGSTTSFLATVQDAFGGTSQYASAREADAEGDDAIHAQERRQQSVEQSRSKAKLYNYAVADFTYEADLMWQWWIWKVPVILFITPSTSPDRDYDVRTWKVAFVSGINSENLLHYIGGDLWLDRLPVWDSSWAPGGKKAYISLLLARPANWIYDQFIKIPSWLVGIVTTGLGGLLIQFLHGMSGKKEGQKKTERRTSGAKGVEGDKDAGYAKSSGLASPSGAAGTKRR